MANRIVDIAGERFNMLTAITVAGKTKSGNITWACVCDCGNKTIIEGSLLRSLKYKSCGCQQHIRTHGMSYTDEFSVWQGIKKRCTNPNSKSFHNYGGRGITMCDEWAESFEAFYSDMGNRPTKKHSIDRIDNHGDYTPDNCHWVTNKSQANNRRNNVLITHNGETLTATQWAGRIGVSKQTIFSRLRKGLTGVEAITAKPRYSR